MKIDDIKNFFNEMYFVKTSQSLTFEMRVSKKNPVTVNVARGNDLQKFERIVSPLMTREKAQQICDSLKKMLPELAQVKIYRSKGSHGQYRAAILNPIQVYKTYALKIAELLNKLHPKSENPWTAYSINNTISIAYTSNNSIYYPRISLLNFSDNDENSQQIKSKKIGYNEQLRQMYPGLQIAIEPHKLGDVYFIDSISYKTLEKLVEKGLDTRTLAIKFFQNQHESLTTKNKIIRIFDFDQTISFHHTFHNPNAYSADNNIKSGVEKLFLHDDNNIAAIATYHNDPTYVKVYVEKLLGKTLTLNTVEDGEHHKVSVYDVKGETTPLIISTLQPKNFGQHVAYMRQTGKNVQIMAVLNYLAKSRVDYKASTIQFYDDSSNNFRHAPQLNGKVNTIESYHVLANAQKFEIIDAIPKHLLASDDSDSDDIRVTYSS
jgi:hypothetical protein